MYKAGFFELMADYFSGVFRFGGYTSRRDFWLITLYTVLLGIILEVVTFVLIFTGLFSFLYIDAPNQGIAYIIASGAVYLIIAFTLSLPSWSMMVRRLRDAGLSNLLIVLCFLFMFTGIVALFMLVATLLPEDTF